MSIYAIVLTEPLPEVTKRIREKYPDAHHLNDTFVLVSGNGIADTIANAIGIKGDQQVDGVDGVVFRLNRAYAGYTSRAVWDWLEQAEQQQ